MTTPVILSLETETKQFPLCFLS